MCHLSLLVKISFSRRRRTRFRCIASFFSPCGQVRECLAECSSAKCSSPGGRGFGQSATMYRLLVQKTVLNGAKVRDSGRAKGSFFFGECWFKSRASTNCSRRRRTSQRREKQRRCYVITLKRVDDDTQIAGYGCSSR